MAKLKIKFQPLFIIYIFICLYFDWVNSIFFYVIAITIHEYAHYVVAKHLGYNMNSIIFSLSGAGLQGNCVFKEKHDIYISLAGPLINLVIIIITVSSWWIIPTSYLFTYDFFICNLSVMLFNLMPVYPLDGGRILMSILSLKNIYKNKIKKINLLISFVFGVVLLMLFIASIFYLPNYNLLIIGVFLTINAIVHDNNKYYSRVLTYNKDYNKPIQIKEFIVEAKDRVELLKYLSPHYYSVFIVRNGDKLLRIEEKDLIM